jgi:hypothetical protein
LAEISAKNIRTKTSRNKSIDGNAKFLTFVIKLNNSDEKLGFIMLQRGLDLLKCCTEFLPGPGSTIIWSLVRAAASSGGSATDVQARKIFTGSFEVPFME